MLVIARNVQESIVIDEGRLIITVLKARDNHVRLLFETPNPSDCVPVHRTELWEKLKAQRALAPSGGMK